MANTVIVPDLIGGISQLPQDQREPNQVEDLENAICSKAFGLRKRPPAETVGNLGSSSSGWEKAFIHGIRRSETERYIVTIVDGDLKVFDALTGQQMQVGFPHGKGYLQNNIRGFSAVTVGDHTFIVNKDRVVRKGSKRSPKPPNGVLIFVRMVDHNQSYTMLIGGYPFSAVSDGPDSDLSTELIAGRLYDSILRGQYRKEFDQQFEYELIGSSIWIQRKDGKDFEVVVNDGLGDKGLKVIKGSVQEPEDLPERAKDGMIVEITGKPESNKDNIWVRFEATDGSGLGVWKQTVKPDINVDLDASTMPHELVWNGTYGSSIVVEELPREPTHIGETGSGTILGWVTDGDDNSVPGREFTKFLNESNSAFRSEPLTTNTALQQIATFTFSVSNTFMADNSYCTVIVSMSTDGSSWTEIARETVYPRAMPLNPTGPKMDTIRVPGVFPQGTRFEIRLEYPGEDNPYITQYSHKPTLAVYGTNSQHPPITVRPIPSMRFNVGRPGAFWPRGARLRVDLDDKVFRYTLPADSTSEQVAQGIASVINSSPDYAADYIPAIPFQAPDGRVVMNYVGFKAEKLSGGPPENASIEVEFDNRYFAWSPDGNMTPGEHVGKVLRNLTSGAEGLVVNNTERTIEVSGLSGGTRNTFLPNDECVFLEDSTAYFVFRRVDWEDREVGDYELNPWPSFVDRRINEVFHHANRLGFTAEDHVIMSASGEPRRFFRGDVRNVLDDDPVDVRNANKDVGDFDWALPWEGRLVLCCSSGHQFSLLGDPYISPATVRIEHMSSYPQSSKCRPITAGTSIYIPRFAGGYTTLRELYITREGFDSEGCTDHVPRLVKGHARAMVADSGLGILAVLPGVEDQGRLYIYHFGRLGDDDRQKAWASWSFPSSDIYGLEMFDGFLYAVRRRGSTVYLERFNLANPPSPTENHRDNGTADYTFRARLSTPYLLNRDGEPITSGRTQIHTLKPVVPSGSLKVEVEPDNRKRRSYVIDKRRKRVPVMAENTAVVLDLVCDTSDGCQVTGLELEVTHSNRSV